MAPLSVYLQAHNALAYTKCADAMTSLAGKAGKSYIIQCFKSKKRLDFKAITYMNL